MAELKRPEPVIVDCVYCGYKHNKYVGCPKYFVRRDNVDRLMECINTTDKDKRKLLTRLIIHADYPLDVDWLPVEFEYERSEPALPLPGPWAPIDIYPASNWAELIITR